MQTVVRLEGAIEILLEKLVELGYFKTKNEAIRAGILELAKEYKITKSAQALEDELAVNKIRKMSEEIKSGKKRVLTQSEAKKKHFG